MRIYKLVISIILGNLVLFGLTACTSWGRDKIVTEDGEVITTAEMWEDMRK